MRPMFHFTPRRIEAHICICFVAYKVYKELERILKTSKIDLSVDKVLNIAKTITTIKINLPISGNAMTKTMLLTKKHKTMKNALNNVMKLTKSASSEGKPIFEYKDNGDKGFVVIVYAPIKKNNN
jgi:hypothetical protein